jgi:hypothetical protein
MNETAEPTTWQWRKGSGGFPLTHDPAGEFFHACDSKGMLACQPPLELGASIEEPDEGSRFCPTCIVVVRGLHGRRLLPGTRGGVR